MERGGKRQLLRRNSAMHRLLCMFGLVCVGSGLGAVYIAQPKVPETLFCEQRIIDLGSLRQMQTAQGTFTLVNGTRKPIQILRVTESCSCSVSNVSASAVEPGGRSEISVKWDIGGRRGKTEVKLWADCAFEDGKGVAVPKVLKGEVIPEYDVEPLEPSFELGVCETQVVRFAPNRLKEVRIEKVLCSHSCLSAKILEDKQSIEIKLHADKWSKGSEFIPWVIVTTNSEVLPTMELWCPVK